MNEREKSALPDHETFMRLWVQHQSQVYAYIRAMVFRRADAEDILQEVAVVLWRKFDQFEPGSRFDQWAYRVARNQVLYYRQKGQRDRLVFGQDLLDRIADEMAAAHPAREGYFDALESCLDGLGADDRELVLRRHEPGATNRSLSRALGRSESAISRALSRIYLPRPRTSLPWYVESGSLSTCGRRSPRRAILGRLFFAGWHLLSQHPECIIGVGTKFSCGPCDDG